MQNHLDASQRSFAMLASGDPFGPPPGHEHYATLTNHNHSSPPGADFGHLLSANGGGGGGGGGGNPSMVNSNHHNHSHHTHSTNNSSNNNNSPSNNNNNNNNNAETKPKKTLPPNGKKTKGRVKIKMEFIDNKLRRYTTFSKRKTGIMKKAYELSTLTGTQVMLLVASETGHVYTFATRKLQPMITSEAGKALIQTCLNSPDPPNSGADPSRMSATGYEETELTYAAENPSDHGDTKVRLSSSPYSAPPQGLGPLHHSPSMYGSPLNNNYHSSPGGGGMMFPHSPSPNSNVLYHYPSDPQPPQCYPGGMHSPSNSPHLAHLTR